MNVFGHTFNYLRVCSCVCNVHHVNCGNTLETFNIVLTIHQISKLPVFLLDFVYLAVYKLFLCICGGRSGCGNFGPIEVPIV